MYISNNCCLLSLQFMHREYALHEYTSKKHSFWNEQDSCHSNTNCSGKKYIGWESRNAHTEIIVWPLGWLPHVNQTQKYKIFRKAGTETSYFSIKTGWKCKKEPEIEHVIFTSMKNMSLKLWNGKHFLNLPRIFCCFIITLILTFH